jgi:hypothetical protein
MLAGALGPCMLADALGQVLDRAGRHRLLGIAEHFEATNLKLRAYIGLLALRRAIVILAKEEAAQRRKLGLADGKRAQRSHRASLHCMRALCCHCCV